MRDLPESKPKTLPAIQNNSFGEELLTDFIQMEKELKNLAVAYNQLKAAEASLKQEKEELDFDWQDFNQQNQQNQQNYKEKNKAYSSPQEDLEVENMELEAEKYKIHQERKKLAVDKLLLEIKKLRLEVAAIKKELAENVDDNFDDAGLLNSLATKEGDLLKKNQEFQNLISNSPDKIINNLAKATSDKVFESKENSQNNQLQNIKPIISTPQIDASKPLNQGEDVVGGFFSMVIKAGEYSSKAMVKYLVNFIDEHPEICRTYYKNNRELPLLFLTIGGVISEATAPIALKVIANCDEVNAKIINAKTGREIGVIEYLAVQKAAGAYDLSEVLDCLVQKGLEVPSMDILALFLKDERAAHASVPSKLAISFIKENDFSLAKLILDQDKEENHIIVPERVSGFLAAKPLRAASFGVTNSSASPISDNSTALLQNIGSHKQSRPNANNLEMNSVREINNLKDYLLAPNGRAADKIFFLRHLIEKNYDGQLKQALEKLKKTHNAQDYQAIIANADLLMDAVAKKHTKTFEILIEAGCDQLKQNEQGINPIGVACREQGAQYLRKYLGVINKKYATDPQKRKEIIAKIINQKDQNGKTALTHAIEGRAYIQVVELLMENGADIGEFTQNISAALNGNHILVFGLLLKKADLFAKEKDVVNKVAQLVISKKDPVFAKCLLDYFAQNKIFNNENNEILKNISGQQIIINETDLPDICAKGSEIYLNMYWERILKNDKAKIASLIHQRGADFLRYAIEGNAYKNVVATLLNWGVEVNCSISNKSNAPESKDDMWESKSGAKKDGNFICLAIQKEEPEVLKILLAAGNIKPEIIIEAAGEVIKLNQALITESFIMGMNAQYLQYLYETDKSIIPQLFERAIESGLQEAITHLLNNCQIAINKKLPHSNKSPFQIALEVGDMRLAGQFIKTKEFSFDQSSIKESAIIKLAVGDKQALLECAIEANSFAAVNYLTRSCKEIMELPLVESGLTPLDLAKAKNMDLAVALFSNEAGLGGGKVAPNLRKADSAPQLPTKLKPSSSVVDTRYSPLSAMAAQKSKQ